MKNQIFDPSLSRGQLSYLKSLKKAKKKILYSRLLLFITFILLWQTASDYKWIDSFYFSSPKSILLLFSHSLFGNILDKSMLFHILITLAEAGISFILIIFIALVCATVFWFKPDIAKILEPTLIVLNSLPKSALAPLIIVWLGTGIKTIILCGISVGVFGCILTLYQSFNDTDPERIKLIQTLGGTRLQAFTKVVFPGNIPAFIAASKVNLGLSLVGVIIGEFLAGRQGLGYLIIYGSQVFKLDLVIMSIAILCIISMIIYALLNLLEKKIAY